MDEFFILKIQNNGQQEVVLTPCSLAIDNIVGKAVKYSIKYYYKLNHKTRNVYV
jgi:hypothetical protein